jgi:hypothetical protein
MDKGKTQDSFLATKEVELGEFLFEDSWAKA